MTRLGAYVQVPFCQTKCTYCNFHTGVFSKELYAPYVQRGLPRDRRIPPPARMKMGSRMSQNRWSTLSISAAERQAYWNPRTSRKLSRRFARHSASQFEEVTLEADPETISPEKAAAWREAGFNRISMGVQSFDDAELRAAGRMHRRADVFEAAKILRAAGFAQSQLRFDRRAPASDRSQLGGLGRAIAAPAARACFDLHDGN